MAQLFDIIVSQLLSGVRRDGAQIGFRYKTSNDKVWYFDEMRQNFRDTCEKHKVLLSSDSKTRDELLATIPILSECIRRFVEYFKQQICEWVQKNYLEEQAPVKRQAYRK